MYQAFFSGKSFMTGQFVREKIEETGISLADVARGLKISPQSLNERLTVKDVKVGALIEIASIIGKDINYFLDDYRKTLTGLSVQEQVSAYSNSRQKQMNISGDLQQLLKAKDETIEALRKTIQAYERMLDEKKVN